MLLGQKSIHDNFRPRKGCALVAKRYNRCYLEKNVDTTNKIGKKTSRMS